MTQQGKVEIPEVSQRGVTLIELVLTIVIVSVAVAGVIGTFSLVTGRSADPLLQSRATALGQLYLDEVMARRYDADTPIGGGFVEDVACSPASEDHSDRNRFGTVNDFHTGGNNPQEPFLAAGSQGLYSGYRVLVEVSCAGGEVSLPEDDAKRIDVTVIDPQDRETVISAYRGNF